MGWDQFRLPVLRLAYVYIVFANWSRIARDDDPYLPRWGCAVGWVRWVLVRLRRRSRRPIWWWVIWLMNCGWRCLLGGGGVGWFRLFAVCVLSVACIGSLFCGIVDRSCRVALLLRAVGRRYAKKAIKTAAIPRNALYVRWTGLWAVVSGGPGCPDSWMYYRWLGE